MFRILFVCHGNICRSPMAEFVMKDLVAKQGRAADFEIASAATSSEELGNPVHPGTVAQLQQVGISCQGKRARKLTARDASEWDLFVGMDDANVRNMRRILGSAAEPRIYKLLEFAGSDAAIADPWYTGDFGTTYDDVVAGCRALLASLQVERA